MKNLFTDKNAPVAERDVYLGLLVTELFSFSIGHSTSQKNYYPASICIDYARYQNKYWKYFNTCLKRFHGYSKADLEGKKQEILLELIHEDIQDAIDGAVNLIEEKLEGINIEKNEFEYYSINLLSKSNKHAHSNLKDLFKRILSNSRYHDKCIHIPIIGNTRLSDFEKKVFAIAKAGLMVEALEHSHKRATQNDDNKFKFKKLVKNIAEACENSLINSKENKLKLKHKDLSLTDLTKIVVNSNEIIGKRLYLIDESGFHKAVEKHIKDNSDKYSIQNSN